MESSDQEIDLSQIERRGNNNVTANDDGESILNEIRDEENDDRIIKEAEGAQDPSLWIHSDDDDIKSLKSQEGLEGLGINGSKDGVGQGDEIYSGSDIDDEDKIRDEDQDKVEEPVAPTKTLNNPSPIRPINFKPQQFQMFENSVDKNSIIFLPTGVGKTVVSMMAMQYYLCKYGKQKKIIFLANTVQLVKQQTEAIRKQLPRVAQNVQLMSFIRNNTNNKMYNIALTPSQMHEYVVCLHGEKNDQMGLTKRKMIEMNSKDRKEIKDKIKKGLIVVMITQMFLNCLRRGYLKLSDCMFIVFDECHHCHGEHPFKNILDEFYFDAKRKLLYPTENEDNDYNEKDDFVPYLMGLTASPVLGINNDVKKIELEIETLCNNLNSTFSKYLQTEGKQFNSSQSVAIEKINAFKETDDDEVEIPDLIEFYKTVYNNPDPFTLSKSKLKIYLPEMFKLVQELEKVLSKQKVTHNAEMLFNNILTFLAVKAVDVWLELGTYALYKLIADIQKQFGELILDRQPDKSVKEQFDSILVKHVGIFQNKFGQCVEQNISEKVLVLINILKEEERDCLQLDKTKKILVFVYQRRIVRYLQKIIETFVENMTDITEEHKERLVSRCVTGSSDQRGKEKGLDNIETAQNPTNQAQQTENVKQTYNGKFRSQRQQYRETQGASLGLRKERTKKDASLTRQLGSVSQTYGEQIRTINDFRQNKFSILLTTSVTEEGFDIPHCNIVISFNRPDQLKSFIQIKGRARAKNSKYIILEFEGKPYKKMEVDKKKYEDTILATGYYAIEKRVSSNYVPVIPPRNPFYRSWRPENSLCCISTNNSLQILMGFINSQRGLHENSKMKVFSYFFKTPETGYTCYLKFHDGLPLDVVKGDICTSKRAAEKSAAFYATVELYKKGYIKEDLKPKNLVELEGEMDLEKVDDFEMMLSDSSYAEILETYSRVEEDDSMKRLKLHFKSILNKQFDFPYINPEFNPTYFRSNTFPFQLYRLSISNKKNSLKPWTAVNSSTNISIGLLTCFKSCDTSSVFTNFHYNMRPGLQEDYRISLVKQSLELSYEQYLKLKKIHDFIVCSASNHQLILLARKNPPEVKAWKQKLQAKKYDFDQREFYPLFTMLQYNPESKEYQISSRTNANILEFEEKLQKVYEFQNSYQKTKTKTEPTKFPFDLNEEMKVFNEEFTPASSGKYIVQSISHDFMLHKCVVVKMAEEEVVEEKEKEVQVGLEKKKESDLRRMFPHAGTSADKKVRVIILRKIIKEIVVSYLCPEKTIKQSMQKEQRTAFRSQFMKYPLDIDVFVQLKFCIDYILPKVGDYCRAYHFRNIFLKTLQTSKLQTCQQEFPKYSFKYPENIIIQKFQQIRSHMLSHSKVELKERASQLINDDDDYKYPVGNILDKIAEMGLNDIPEPKDREKYVLREVVNELNINEILRSLTSKIYKSDRKENYEEYEFIGDVVLKMLATIEVFTEKNTGDESALHLGRANIVSNANLREVSIRNKLFLYIMTNPLKEPSAPLKLYYDASNIQSESYKSSRLLKVNSASEQEGFCYIPFKQHADVLQALIGVYYLSNIDYNVKYNLNECQFFLYSMGVLKYPTLKLTQEVADASTEIPQFKLVEQRLKHKFVNKNLLVQAFTHRTFETVVKEACDGGLNDMKKRLETENFATMMNNEKTVFSSMIQPHEFYYERLQFLGDSVLDLVAVEYIYEKNRGRMSEGDFSLLKQVSVSNKTLGLVALFWGLDQFILMNSKETIRQFKQLRDRFTTMYQNPDEIFTKQAAPLKILGDIMEAYVGAVFLDCQFDYDHTRAICRRLIAPFIDYFTSQSLLSKHPQYKFKQHLKSNNQEDVRVKKTEKIVAGGKFQYVLVDRGGNEIVRCNEVNLKKAEDLLIEMYMEQKGFKKEPGTRKEEMEEGDDEEGAIVEVRSGV